MTLNASPCVMGKLFELKRKFLSDRETPQYQSAYTKREPLVTVCIGTFNREHLLMTRSVPSVLAQTYKNLQLIVIGDHCSDGTIQRLSQLRDSRVIAENLPKRGPYPPPGPSRWMVAGTYTFNRALELSGGDFIAHLDDDDEMLPNRIETMVEQAQKYKADFLWHRFLWEQEDGQWTERGKAELETSYVTTGSIFYHNWFKCIPWNVRAYRVMEPGDWNRIAKIRFLGPRLRFVDKALIRHFLERTARSGLLPGEETLPY